MDGSNAWSRARIRISAATGTEHGWLMGLRVSGSPPNLRPVAADNDERCFNLTTVRYSPNQEPFANQLFPGMGSNVGANNPLMSFHAGGVHILLGDGSVRFLSENIHLETLKQLATRDDRQPIGEFELPARVPSPLAGRMSFVQRDVILTGGIGPDLSEFAIPPTQPRQSQKGISA